MRTDPTITAGINYVTYFIKYTVSTYSSYMHILARLQIFIFVATSK